MVIITQNASQKLILLSFWGDNGVRGSQKAPVKSLETTKNGMLFGLHSLKSLILFCLWDSSVGFGRYPSAFPAAHRRVPKHTNK